MHQSALIFGLVPTHWYLRCTAHTTSPAVSSLLIANCQPGMLVESWSCRARDGNILSVLNENKREHHLSRCLAGLARYYKSEDGRECSMEYLVRAYGSLHEHVRGPLGSRLASGVVDQTSRVNQLHSCVRDSDRKALLSFQNFLSPKEQAYMRNERKNCLL
jgi:hypothetical protein